ncbi:UNVERIFIED_CONTAM: hypothetical protein NCL1_18059 [Trichonephila clavipes]
MRKDYRPSRRRIFLSHNRSSCAVKQFHSDVSWEAVDDRRCGQRVMIDICSAWFLNHRTAAFRQSAARSIDGCVCNGLMSAELGKLIVTKLSFQMNHASICETIMAAFVLDAMLVNVAFQSALSEDIVA